MRDAQFFVSGINRDFRRLDWGGLYGMTACGIPIKFDSIASAFLLLASSRSLSRGRGPSVGHWLYLFEKDSKNEHVRYPDYPDPNRRRRHE